MKLLSNSKVTMAMAGLVAVILVLEPFYAFMTVGAASLTGHYTAWRLWDEVLLAILLAGGIYLFLIDKDLRSELMKKRLLWLILAYVLIQLIWGVVAFTRHGVDAKALGYGWIVNLRFLLFFLVVWLVARRLPGALSRWPRLLLIPAAVVVVFGLLQAFVLPHDFLKHFGYGASTIEPYETINNNQNYIRVSSTLRGANPLGAYLVLIVSAVAVWLIAAKRKLRPAIFLSATLVVLFFSFSRSAWIGAMLSLLTVAWLGWRHQSARQIILIGLLAVVLIGGSLAFALRNDARFQNYFFHTETQSKIKISSNGSRASALASGVDDLATDPLGDGPGTAGPASVYNDHPARIAENYFVQVGQETGWLGLAVFVAILVEVARLLWQNQRSSLALTLLAALLGLTFINLLSHAWTDDTLAYTWWGLAAVALGTPLATKKLRAD